MRHARLLPLLAAALTMAACGPTAEEAALRNIMTRVSIRKYEQRPVEAEKVEKLLRGGMAAPTSHNRQPWHFVVLSDTAIIRRYAAGSGHHAEMIAQTPLHIFVCGDTTRMSEGAGRDFWVLDASAASENILLAAHAMGLGAVWLSVYPMQKKIEGVSRKLHLGGELIPLCDICVGYPAESPEPKDKWDPGKVTTNPEVY